MKNRKIKQLHRNEVLRNSKTPSNCGGRKRGGCSRVSTWESMIVKTFERV